VLASLIAVAVIWLTSPVATAGGEGCSGCHDDVTAIAHPHPPVSEDCGDCHVADDGHPDDGDVQLADEEPALCFLCHDAFDGTTIHQPVREGECSACHDPHGTDQPFLLPVGHHQQELCFSCHEESLAEHEHDHGPAASGQCTFCHDPHAADQPHLLRRKIQDLCLQCHTELAKGIRRARVVHTAIRDQQCIACHQPHGSDFSFILKADQQRICFTCHEELGTLYGSARSKHKPLYGEQGCGTCHFTHYADKNALLREEEPSLCFDCHGRDSDPSSPRPMRNIAREIQGKKYVHAPLEEEGCTGCHDPHGSRHPQLLSEEYPESFYSPYDRSLYAFCFQCHDAALVESERTETDTGFRNGTINLHYLHVNKVRKGRTCRSCHEPHAGDSPKLVTTLGARFGEWRIPIRFRQDEHGGRCAPGCHRELRYDRDEPVDYTQDNQP